MSSLSIQSKAAMDQARRKLLRETRTAWMYIAPAIVLMLFISFLPQAYQVYMAFTDYRLKNLRMNVMDPSTWEEYAPPFVGLQNFQDIVCTDTGLEICKGHSISLQNYNFLRILRFNIVWTVANIIFHVGLGILIAVALNSKALVYGRRVFRAIFILPWAVPGFITALVWARMYNSRFGMFNLMIKQFNAWFGTDIFSRLDWIGHTKPAFLEFTPEVLKPFVDAMVPNWLPTSFFAVLFANIWLGWPFMAIVATGALQSIPAELYEAAAIDGATDQQQFWKITLPLLRPAMMPAIMLGTIMTFNQFNVIFFISEGGPKGLTEILITQAYKLVQQQRLYGIAAAFSIIVFFILLLLTLLQNTVTRATESYDA